MNIIEMYFSYKLIINVAFSCFIGLFLLFTLMYHVYDEYKGRVKRK